MDRFLRVKDDLDQTEPQPKRKGATHQLYIAKSIGDDRSLPEATAVAVRDGMVIEVSSLESLQPWLIREDHVIHRDWSSVMVPGSSITSPSGDGCGDFTHAFYYRDALVIALA